MELDALSKPRLNNHRADSRGIQHITNIPDSAHSISFIFTKTKALILKDETIE